MIKKFLKKIGLFNQAKWVYTSCGLLKNTLRNALFPTAVILTYHRVAVSDNDPHQLAVNPLNFRAQMIFLKEHYQVISLEALLTAIKHKAVKRDMVVLTFDDGYADNLYNALPVLEELNLPATVFVSSGNIDGESFYWDGRVAPDYGRPLTAKELGVLTASRLITIGGHTVSHPHIPALQREQKIIEISADRKVLKNFCGTDVAMFAFPFGEWDKDSLAAVKNAGYGCSCVLREQRVTNRSDLFLLPRFLVRNWELYTFAKKMKRKFL